MHTSSELTERQEKILTAYSRLLEGYRERRLRNSKKDFLTEFAVYGFRSIMIGDVPEDIKADARDWLEAAHDLCKSKGLDSTRMFSDEILDIVIHEHIDSNRRSYKRLSKATQKMSRLAHAVNISALKSRTIIIGNKIVRSFYYSSSQPLQFTEDDKDKLFNTKSETVESILEAIKTLPDHEWSIGIEGEKTTLSEFVKYSQLATWITIERTLVYYCNRQEREDRGCLAENPVPFPGDDTKRFSINFCLYPTFEQSEEKDPIGEIYFSVDGEIAW